MVINGWEGRPPILDIKEGKGLPSGGVSLSIHASLVWVMAIFQMWLTAQPISLPSHLMQHISLW